MGAHCANKLSRKRLWDYKRLPESLIYPWQWHSLPMFAQAQSITSEASRDYIRIIYYNPNECLGHSGQRMRKFKLTIGLKTVWNSACFFCSNVPSAVQYICTTCVWPLGGRNKNINWIEYKLASTWLINNYIPHLRKLERLLSIYSFRDSPALQLQVNMQMICGDLCLLIQSLKCCISLTCRCGWGFPIHYKYLYSYWNIIIDHQYL